MLIKSCKLIVPVSTHPHQVPAQVVGNPQRVSHVQQTNPPTPHRRSTGCRGSDGPRGGVRGLAKLYILCRKHKLNMLGTMDKDLP